MHKKSTVWGASKELLSAAANLFCVLFRIARQIGEEAIEGDRRAIEAEYRNDQHKAQREGEAIYGGTRVRKEPLTQEILKSLFWSRGWRRSLQKTLDNVDPYPKLEYKRRRLNAAESRRMLAEAFRLH